MSIEGLGRRFVEALAARDRAAITALLGRVTTPDGPHLVEQQAYYSADDRIHYLRVLCSGFRPIGADD
jgi:hypothetical protein